MICSNKQSKKISAKEKILKATEQVIVKLGAGNLTLDAVVKEAGISKGGLLYHYPNKEALLMAMLDRFVFSYRDRINDILYKNSEKEDNYLKAHILAIEKSREEMSSMALAVLAFIANNPEKAQRLKDHISDDWEILKAMSKDVKTAMLITSALNGLALFETLGLSSFSPDEKEQLIKLLKKIADRGVNEEV